jgi:hypothetical protein
LAADKKQGRHWATETPGSGFTGKRMDAHDSTGNTRLPNMIDLSINTNDYQQIDLASTSTEKTNTNVISSSQKGKRNKPSAKQVATFPMPANVF